MIKFFKKIIGMYKQFFFDLKERLLASWFDDGTNRRRINYIFRIRHRIFFKKKQPVSDAYPFTVVDPFDVFGEENRFGDFSLVGDDWYDKNSVKPVAILWGFNNWKWGFVSDYLPEYRTAFAPRKIFSLHSILIVKRFSLKPDVFIFWGYTEPWCVRWYARVNNIKIYRMEDGFIRSSSLGASHSTPYSLLLDSKGLHYNPEEVSDIEEILNFHTFSDEELASAKICMDLMLDLSLSKYNPPIINSSNKNNIKIRKRVAVLGQVDNDMSVRMGNPDCWSMIELIRLAKFENPGSDIIYRPHPDVYQGYQKSKFRSRSVENICEIVSPDIPIVEFLDTIDHVYTITSLSGLEALLRGKKVTVVGTAFYAGWGLTDDRVEFPRRTAKRSLLELFSGVYLIYPRYLADLTDNYIGFQAACLRIKADCEIELFEMYNSQKADTEQNIKLIARSNYWPQLLFKKQTEENEYLVQKSIELINFERLLINNPGRLFQIVLIYSVCGSCKSNFYREIFINNVRNYIDRDILNFLLLDLGRIYPGEYISRQFAWCLAEINENVAALEILKDEHVRIQEENLRLIVASVNENNKDNDKNENITSDLQKQSISLEESRIMFEVFEHNIAMRKFDDAIEISKILLLSGFYTQLLLNKMAKLADIKFDNNSAKNIAKLSQYLNLYDQNRAMALVEARSFTECFIEINNLEFIQSLVKLIRLKPDRINDANFLLEKFSKNLSNKKFEKIFSGILMLDNEQSIRKSSAYIAIEKPLLSLKIMENLIVNGGNSDSIRIAYSQALSYADRFDDAINVMNDARKLEKTSANYCESLRLYVIGGLYDQALNLLRDAQLRKIDLGDMHPRKVYFGCRMVKEAFETFTELSIKKSVATYYPDKYFQIKNNVSEADKLILLSIFGPGDEIRFASVYNMFPSKLVLKDITISCEPRLLNIMTQSFKNLKFIPVSRPRDSERIDLQDYTNVLGSDLIRVIDNTATDAINNSDHVMLVTDMLHECLTSYETFPGKAYLKHDDDLEKYYRNRLPKNVKLFGLSWRSSLTTHSRNEHYLTVQDLEPIFKIDDLQFVNFQYDECQEELDWIEKRYPGKVINISEIDHYNDFDSVAALMKCMDLMISPATTVVELAGALGCPTWLLSNSSELHWRKIDMFNTDVWHNSITHIEGDVLGDKSSLVDNLCMKLSVFAVNK